jgi:archaellum component FlaF (FlaF/FlaG flagellin family)
MFSLVVLNDNQSNWYQIPMTIVITFKRAAESKAINAVSAFRDLSIQNLNQGIDIFTNEYNVSITHMYVDITTKNANNILKLSISYIYFQPYD